MRAFYVDLAKLSKYRSAADSQIFLEFQDKRYFKRYGHAPSLTNPLQAFSNFHTRRRLSRSISVIAAAFYSFEPCTPYLRYTLFVLNSSIVKPSHSSSAKSEASVNPALIFRFGILPSSVAQLKPSSNLNTRRRLIQRSQSTRFSSRSFGQTSLRSSFAVSSSIASIPNPVPYQVLYKKLIDPRSALR